MSNKIPPNVNNSFKYNFPTTEDVFGCYLSHRELEVQGRFFYDCPGSAMGGKKNCFGKK